MVSFITSVSPQVLPPGTLATEAWCKCPRWLVTSGALGYGHSHQLSKSWCSGGWSTKEEEWQLLLMLCKPDEVKTATVECPTRLYRSAVAESLRSAVKVAGWIRDVLVPQTHHHGEQK